MIKYKHSSGNSTINLGFMIVEGSETLMDGSTVLTKGIDYTIDYFSGTLTLISERAKNNAFVTLVRSVVGQQISVKAADSVWKKLEKLCRNAVEPDTINSFSEEELRTVGLSKSKANYIQNISKSDVLDTNWANLSDKEVIDLLCQIKGIGKG